MSHPDEPFAQGLLLTTKLYVPSPRPDLVARSRLVRQIDAGRRLGHKLTLVAAPAGFGKTTLLSAWTEQAKQPVAWLSLDPGDNDPAQFLRYLVASLRTIQDEIGATTLSWLHAAQPPAPEILLTPLVNELMALAEPFTLLLDDYHLLTEPSIHRALAFLLDQQPPAMHLVIASRIDPPLPLARLRAQGQLTELREAELRFTQEEAAEFLNQIMGLTLSPADIRALESRTEGWIAGLQLAALALQGSTAAETGSNDFVRSFTGSHRYVTDYLTDEVLDRQPQERRRFLLQTAMLDRLCGPLCDAVTGRDDSHRLLEAFDTANLFLVSLDNQRYWYRYHHLFAELLRHRLDQEAGDQIADLHRRAAVWYEENGLTAEAIRHALASADWVRAERLIEPLFFPMMMRGQQFTAKHWLEQIPKAVLQSHPQLSLYYAWALLFTGQVDAYERPLQDAERLWQGSNASHGLGQVYNLRANVARLRGEAPRTIELAKQALALLPDDDRFQRSIGTMALGAGYLLTGEVLAAEKTLTRAHALSQAADNLITLLIVLNRLGDVQVLQGRLRAAAQTYQTVLDRAADRPLWQRVEAHIGLGDLHYEWNNLEKAEEHLQQGRELAQQTKRAIYFARGYVSLARLLQARDQFEQAEAMLDRALEAAAAFGDVLAASYVRAYRARLALRGGDRATVDQWLATAALNPDADLSYPRQFEYLTLARVLIAQNEPDAVVDLLARLSEAAEAAERYGDVVEILMLSALAHRAGGRPDEALTALEGALKRAGTGGYVRTFVDEGEPIKRLLRRMATGGAAPHVVSKLLAALGELIDETVPASQPLVEALTAREREVLHLIADGATNRQIATALVISIHTVKKHISNIYGKLGVGNRTQALARAQKLDLL